MTYRIILAALMLSVAFPVRADPPEGTSYSTAGPPVVIPFDFESKFDDGRYGRIVGDLIWKSLDRRGGTILPESMLDVRDWTEQHKMVPNPDTSLDKMKAITRDDFGADVSIWGKVERVAGFDWDVYDVWIFVADFSGDKPRMIYKEKARTKTVSEIPHVHIKAALNRLLNTPPQAVVKVDPEREKRWRSGPNLVQGDFERGVHSPVGWDPLSKQISLRILDSDSASKNRIIRFELPGNVAATTGVLYYSDYFPVEEGAVYRFQCRWRSTGSECKVFIKCYDEMESKYYKKDKRTRRGDDVGSRYQRREVYRSQQNLKVEKDDNNGQNGSYEHSKTTSGRNGAWHVHTEDFTPKHTQFTPRSGRVMLYAYWPAGTVEWDDIVVKQIALPPKNSKPKVRRPSSETKVLSEELERTRGR